MLHFTAFRRREMPMPMIEAEMTWVVEKGDAQAGHLDDAGGGRLGGEAVDGLKPDHAVPQGRG